MNSYIVAILLLVLLAVSYQIGWAKSRAVATANGVKLHSRPQYHGVRLVLWTIIPALCVLLLWWWFGSDITNSYATGLLPQDVVSQGAQQTDEALRRVFAIASGYGVIGDTAEWENAAGAALHQFQTITFLAVIGLCALIGVVGLLYARARITPRLRARNQVEGFVSIVLIVCSAVAILTTVGIVISLLTEAIRFFTFVSPIDFFFGTVWRPVFQSTGTDAVGSYGLIPLLWGTIMVSGIAMIVAVPIGLMSAIYLNQYAPARLRSVVKPVIEVLAGIPTIVYGFFALVTVGPALAAFGETFGFDVRATSAATAGLVMGVMIIPFISSLSDDILNQVPISMRDGSYGLGATQSETIRRVLLPAALPGIVGAFLLAVSRAIGETMIVVLAAGNSPVFRLNPFEPTSTVTVTIVNQLTGDSDFAGPQSLVAFALGLTLFVLTLILNVVALYIVRRFREQYE